MEAGPHWTRRSSLWLARLLQSFWICRLCSGVIRKPLCTVALFFFNVGFGELNFSPQMFKAGALPSLIPSTLILCKKNNMKAALQPPPSLPGCHYWGWAVCVPRTPVVPLQLHSRFHDEGWADLLFCGDLSRKQLSPISIKNLAY